jgi:hypothetical protein
VTGAEHRVGWRWLRLAAASLAAAALALPTPARAEVSPPRAEQVGRVQSALDRGAFSEAIDQLELWSDQGIVHPDLSFNRGVSYLGRAESSAKRPADLGQAAAAFEEALHLNPEDPDAEVVLERIRAAIGERRAKNQAEGVVARPRLLRALLDLVGENVWAFFAGLGSLSLSLGLGARLLMRSHRARLAGSIAAVVGLLVLALGAGMTAAGRHLRTHYVPAVVIVEEARLHDADGRPFSAARGPSTLGEAGDRVPEGSLVYIAGTRGALVEVEWGDMRAWLNARELRRLARNPN